MALSGLADCALKICDWTRTGKLAGDIEAHVAKRQSIVTPVRVSLLQAATRPLQLECARSYVADRIPVLPQPLWDGEIRHHDRIRVGYLSADFHHHATAFLIAELFELPRSIHALKCWACPWGWTTTATCVPVSSKSFDRFHDVRQKGDREVATLMSELELDIAVDLKGYTQDSRPGILAHRPAPIGVSFLGYPGTMGGGVPSTTSSPTRLFLPARPAASLRRKDRSPAGVLPGQRFPKEGLRPVYRHTPRRRASGRARSCSAPSTTTTRSRRAFSMCGCGFWVVRRRQRPVAVCATMTVPSGICATKRRAARHRPGASGVRQPDGGGRAPGAPSPSRPVPRHIAGQRPHHREAMALWGGAALGHPALGSRFAGRVAASLLDAVGLPEFRDA